MTSSRLGQRAREPFAASPRDCAPIGASVERLLAREVGDAEAAADVERCARAPARARASSMRELERLVLRLDDGFGAQVLRAAEDVEADEVERQRRRGARASPARARRRRRTASAPPPIFMPERLELEVRDSRARRRARAWLRPRASSRETLAVSRSDSRLTRDAGRERGCSSSSSRLARAREADVARGDAPVASATRSSPAEATSRPSTSRRHVRDDAGIGFAFIA